VVQEKLFQILLNVAAAKMAKAAQSVAVLAIPERGILHQKRPKTAKNAAAAAKFLTTKFTERLFQGLSF
jgi:hypothetical protein